MTQDELYRALGDVDDALLDEFEHLQKVPRTKKPWKPAAALAACAALLLGTSMLLRSSIVTQRPEVPASTQPAPSSAASEPITVAAPTPIADLPALTFAAGGFEVALDIGYPEGYFIRALTDAQLAAIWGQEDLRWEGVSPAEAGYAVTGEVIYDGTGTPWVVRVHLNAGDEQLQIELSPGQLPPQCLATDAAETCYFYDTPVSAYDYGAYRTVDFLRGAGDAAVGVRLTLWGTGEALTELATRITAQSLRPDATLQVLFLATADIPEWRSKTLDEAAAYADAEFGAYLPAQLPTGFDFETAHRELGDDRNWLSAVWTDGAGSELVVEVSHPDDVPNLVHADQLQAYSWDYYSAEKPDVPDEYFATWQEPVFYAEELTAEVTAARIHPIDNVGVYQANFGVLYPDGTLVRLHGSAPRATLEALLAPFLTNSEG